MAALTSLVALALQVAAPADTDPVRRWRRFIEEASLRSGIPSEWIERVLRAESGGRTTLGGRPITSRAGAMGLMQLMPGTWAQMRAALGLDNDPHDPRDNILAGAFYLRLMYDRFGYPGLFGAYNAGPARYAASLATGRALPAETRTYLATVGGAGLPETGHPVAHPVNAIFFQLGRTESGPPRRSSNPDGMFVTLSGVVSPR